MRSKERQKFNNDENIEKDENDEKDENINEILKSYVEKSQNMKEECLQKFVYCESKAINMHGMPHSFDEIDILHIDSNDEIEGDLEIIRSLQK